MLGRRSKDEAAEHWWVRELAGRYYLAKVNNARWQRIEELEAEIKEMMLLIGSRRG